MWQDACGSAALPLHGTGGATDTRCETLPGSEMLRGATGRRHSYRLRRLVSESEWRTTGVRPSYRTIAVGAEHPTDHLAQGLRPNASSSVPSQPWVYRRCHHRKLIR